MNPRGTSWLKRWVSGAVTVALGAVLSACSPGYVLRAGYEEAKILWSRQPIEEVLQQESLDPATRRKLELVLRVREFARTQLRLNVGGRYSTYASVDDTQVVYVVTAAQRFRLEPYTWWFPIVGSVPYKGYFSEDEARAEAARLEAEGFDTYVRSSSAFSTLGWFDDPLLSTMLRRDPVTVVETVIHELLHSTSYLGGQAAFDESFANFVGQRGAVAFFRAEGDPASASEAEDRWRDALRFSAFITAFAAELREAYAVGITEDERVHFFERAQARFLDLPFRTKGYTGFASLRLNNAIVLHELLYFDRLSLFEDAVQNTREDLAATIHAIIDATAAQSADPFGALARLATSGLERGQPPYTDPHREREDRNGQRQSSH